jgi:hypothetical protein
MTMIKQARRLPVPLLTVVAASLATVMFTSYARAQCLECDEYQNRDPFTQGLVTTPPANQPGTTSAKPYRNPYNSRAEMRADRNHHLRHSDRRHP